MIKIFLTALIAVVHSLVAERVVGRYVLELYAISVDIPDTVVVPAVRRGSTSHGFNGTLAEDPTTRIHLYCELNPSSNTPGRPIVSEAQAVTALLSRMKEGGREITIEKEVSSKFGSQPAARLTIRVKAPKIKDRIVLAVICVRKVKDAVRYYELVLNSDSHNLTRGERAFDAIAESVFLLR